MKAGYIEFKGSERKYSETLKGVPQGGIISPLLSNLMLHELDKFVDKLKARVETGNAEEPRYLPNEAYTGLNQQLYTIERRKKAQTEGRII